MTPRQIIDYFLCEPRRLRALGQLCITLASALSVAACVGWMTRSLVAVVQDHVPTALPTTLAELVPTIWTWWIPETAIGMVPTMILFGFGIWLKMTSKLLHACIG